MSSSFYKVTVLVGFQVFLQELPLRDVECLVYDNILDLLDSFTSLIHNCSAIGLCGFILCVIFRWVSFPFLVYTHKGGELCGEKTIGGVSLAG